MSGQTADSEVCSVYSHSSPLPILTASDNKHQCVQRSGEGSQKASRLTILPFLAVFKEAPVLLYRDREVLRSLSDLRYSYPVKASRTGRHSETEDISFVSKSSELFTGILFSYFKCPGLKGINLFPHQFS